MSGDLPIVEELIPPVSPEVAFQRLWDLPHCLFLDSARRHPELGRYSFLAADPFDFLSIPIGAPSPLLQVRRWLDSWKVETIPGLPPFQGGAAGLFSYDLGRSFEAVPRPRHDEFVVPAVAMGVYDVVLAFDHHLGRAWIISHGIPAMSLESRQRRAAERLQGVRHRLNRATVERPLLPNSNVVSAKALAPQFEVGTPRGLTSDFSPSGYLDAARRAVDYIHAGDVFQINLSQRLLYSAEDDSRDLYLRLRACNPATFAAYFDLGEYQIVSASPERFLRAWGGEVEARPIKGTRARVTHPVADLYVGDELMESEKDRAENVMIVDLLRNDLSRVCQPQSVQVTQLCGVETYEYVQHLVSVIRGSLSPGRHALDLLRCAFPGGSITGAPKVRAMEIIAEIEPTARGAYCGSLGYVGFNGALDLSILIRTITAGRGWWQLPVGGGIVAQSSPQAEYEETWHKAEGLLRALSKSC